MTQGAKRKAGGGMRAEVSVSAEPEVVKRQG